MRCLSVVLAAVGLCLGTAAHAQYYPAPPPGYYYGPPQQYYQGPPPGYYQPRYYRPPPPGALTRVGPGDPGYQPWRPRFDPRNGGYYCVQQGYTVQDGVCKPGPQLYRRW